MNRYSGIVEIVSRHTGITAAKINGRIRTVPIFDARALAMYLIWNTRSQDMAHRKTTTIRTISRHFHRDRATVVNAIMRVEDRVRTCEEFAESVWKLRSGLAIDTFLADAAERGWRMVPDEATEEMVLKGARNIGQTMRTPNHIERAKSCHRTMLAAAPKFEWDK